MWKDIPNWETLYEINEYGDVRNKLSNKLIVGDNNSIGYSRVCLYNKNHNPQKQRFFRHRLVAQLFVDNPNNYKEVNHIDHNINNCKFTNLEWVDRIQNELDSRKYGSKEYKPYRVIYADGTCELFDTKGQLARKLNMTSKMIGHWLHKRSFSYVNHGILNIEWIAV